MEVKSLLMGIRGVSLPFTDYCEPIADSETSFKDILYSALDYGKKRRWKFIEIRGGQGLLNAPLSFSTYYSHKLSLQNDVEKLYHNFRKGTKSSIKKAYTEGVKVKIFSSLESVKEFYELNCITRRHHGLPPQPWRFFQQIYNAFISKDFGIVILASYKTAIVAGALFLCFGDSAIYKYSASYQKNKHLSATNLILWEAIQHYALRGIKSLSFGRTDFNNEGLRTFKRGWGTEEQIINYYLYEITGKFKQNHSTVSTFAKKVFRKMPLFLLKEIGNIAYGQFG